MILSIVPTEINIICDDEEKLIGKVCPQLEPIKVSSSTSSSRDSKGQQGFGPSSQALYLIATLGEPDDELTSRRKA